MCYVLRIYMLYVYIHVYVYVYMFTSIYYVRGYVYLYIRACVLYVYMCVRAERYCSFSSGISCRNIITILLINFIEVFIGDCSIRVS